jgi:hypothetical protein
MEAVRLSEDVIANQQINVSKRKRNRQNLFQTDLSVELNVPTSCNRKNIEKFIAKRFQAAYGADLSYFMRYLLTLSNDTGTSGAMGFQPAEDVKPLFLETYLQQPIEQILSFITNKPVARRSIVEVGNLASYNRRTTQTLFVLLAELLKSCGCDWLVFTANSSVLSWVKNLGPFYISLGEADPALLPDKGEKWGSYYEDKPVVLACYIKPDFKQLACYQLIKFLRNSYGPKLTEFSEILKST